MKTSLLIFLFLISSIGNIFADWKPGDTLVDERDGALYKTVVIGSQCWMAENLNYGRFINTTDSGSQQSNNGIIEKYCWTNGQENCDGSDTKIKRGGLYEWQEAMQYWTGQPKLPVYGICPDGWHLPSKAEWTTLFNFLGGTTAAVQKLLQGGSSGFNAVMTGLRYTVSGNFRASLSSESDFDAYFWSSEQTDGNNATSYELGPSSLKSMTLNKFNGLCIRCLSNVPKINLDKSSLDFNVIFADSDSIIPLEISNKGEANLIIDSILIVTDPHCAFNTNFTSNGVIIKPDSIFIIDVIYSPKYLGTCNSQLKIYSNDLANPIKIIPLTGYAIQSSVDENPEESGLELNIQPNPAWQTATVSFNYHGNMMGLVHLNLVDINGNLIKELYSNIYSGGENQIEFKTENISSGKYYLIFKLGNQIWKKSVIIAK